jgi:subtilisin family serine protease
MKRLVVYLTALALVCGLAATLAAEGKRSVLIRAAKPYDRLVAAIERAGGTVTHKYKFVDGIAAEIPESALPAIAKLVGPDNIARDEMLHMPAADHARTGSPYELSADVEWVLDAGTVTAAAEQLPDNYDFNRTLNGLDPLAAAGHMGSGMIVAIIDSGYRPQFTHVAPGRIIGPGFSFVPGEPDAIHENNTPHGTQVAGFVASATGFCVNAASRWVQVAEFYGQAIVHPACGANRAIFMTGSAPAASIVPFKIFPFSGAGSPTSRTIAGDGEGDRASREVRRRGARRASTSAC